MSAMEQQRRITPPPELMEQWQDESPETQIADHIQYLAIRAAQWGWDQREPEIQAAADQELEACCKLMEYKFMADSGDLRAARRPKPPSLAEQATAGLDDAVMRGDCITTTDAMPLLRAALKRLAELEALPND
jgi:hypothetical protein